MSVGIKIRALDNTTFIGASDVFIVDTPNPLDTGLSYTKNVKYSDLILQLNTDLQIPDSGGGEAEEGDYFLLKQGETVVLKVTVGDKTSTNRYLNEGFNKCFYINGNEAPQILMTPGRTYRFDTSEVPSEYPMRFTSTIRASYGSISDGVTNGNGFIEYKATDKYSRLYYSGPGSSYMGAAMLNFDSSQEWNPGGRLEEELNKITTLDNTIQTTKTDLNSDIQAVQLDTNTLQSTQTNNNQTLLTHTSDIGDLELEVSNLKNQIASMNNVISQMNNHLTELGIVIETE